MSSIQEEASPEQAQEKEKEGEIIIEDQEEESTEEEESSSLNLFKAVGVRYPSYWQCISYIAPSSEKQKWKPSDAVGVYCSECKITINYDWRKNPKAVSRHMDKFHKDLLQSFGNKEDSQKRQSDGKVYDFSPKQVKKARVASKAYQDMSFQSTPDLCDAFEDSIRIVDPCLGLKNLGKKTHFGGKVVTVKCFEDNSLVKDLAKTDGKNKVMVVDGGGSRRRALLGDQVALDCVNHGWEGLVIYGSIRDVDEIGALPLGVQALGTHPCKTIKRNEGQKDTPVTFGGVTFTPGDCIVCDNNGIVVNSTPLNSDILAGDG